MSSRTEFAIESIDMSEELKEEIIDLARKALSTKELTEEKDYAKFIKEELEKVHTGSWQVIVGKSFGSSVKHDRGYFIYFYIDNLAFLVFRIN